MKSYFEKQTKELYDRAIKIIDITQMLKSNKKREKFHDFYVMLHDSKPPVSWFLELGYPLFMSGT